MVIRVKSMASLGLLALLAQVPAATAWATTAAAVPAVDPAATAAMDRMNTSLRSLADFTVDADVTNEDVLESGEKIQYGGTLLIQVHKPNGLKMVISSDSASREFYYDGTSLTVVAPRLGYYTSVAAPASLGVMMNLARTKYGIEFPLSDLFSWGTDQWVRHRVTQATVIGSETVGSRACTHYAFRQAAVDWQIWIADDANARPCKLVITDTTDSSRPQYSAVLHWHDAAPIDPATFAYVPGPDAHKIMIADLSKGAK